MKRALLLASLLSVACGTGVDPDQGLYACSDAADCGPGYDCVPQLLETTGRCHASGSCHAEVCNGLDDDCNGVADDGFDLNTDGNDCGACGHVCSAGLECAQGVCVTPP